MTGTDHRDYKAENNTKQYRKYRDQQRILQTLYNILISVIFNKVIMKTLRQGTLRNAGLRIDCNDNLLCC